MPKVCPPEKILNQATNRCVSKTGKIGKAILKSVHSSLSKEEKEKPKKDCPPDKLYNPSTGRCVSKTGKIGKKLLAGKKSSEVIRTKPVTKDKKKKSLQKHNSEKHLVPRDLQILEYSIGRPVSVVDAKKHFLCEHITVEKQQITPNGLYLDPITLEEVPLSEMVQLRETKEVMSREVFDTYFIEPNTKKWCGKSNVGFKSPNGTVFGNLVLYNYDQSPGGFFPQKSGTLKISKTMKQNFYHLKYNPFNFSFYIPATKEGTVLLCMMKDAFKKGNLFAFSQKGRIRHGRIHKKTSLTGIYGFPDASYIDRALGELNLLGSSPYIYQFS